MDVEDWDGLEHALYTAGNTSTCSYYIATWKTEAIIKDMQEFTRPLGAYLRLVLSQSGVA